MHPAALATGIAAIDTLIAGQAVYAVRRRDRRTRRDSGAIRNSGKGDAH